MLTDQITCNIVVEVLRRHGLRDAVVSPGSRNTPLILAFDDVGDIRMHVATDERSAGFIALGISQITRKPVALVCTSGTAVLNYAPAVAEAYYQGIPLIVISADRPGRWIDQDDSQTIRQYGVLQNFVKESYNLPCCNGKDDEWYVNRMTNDALMKAGEGKRGPVHLNVEIDEPLSRPLTADIPTQRTIETVLASKALSRQDLMKLTDESEGKRILVVGGFHSPDDRLNRALSLLSELPNVYLLAETISNLHLNYRFWAVDTILSAMSAEEKESLRPDIVISFGGALVSRLIKEFLREYAPAQHWTVGYDNTTVDCFKALTRRVVTDPDVFFRGWARSLQRRENDSDYRRLWNGFRERSLASQKNYIDALLWCDMRAYRQIFDSIPSDFNLQLSNGTTIRYAQILMDRLPHANFCNRGVSGIDGSTATAVGASIPYGGTTLLVTGDMSFSYDLGVLWNKGVSQKLKIIVINNSGGGIFRFVRSTSGLDVREKYFCADPEIDIKGIAEASGFGYLYADSDETLKQSLEKFYENRDVSMILEVKTPPDYSAVALKEYFKRK